MSEQFIWKKYYAINEIKTLTQIITNKMFHKRPAMISRKIESRLQTLDETQEFIKKKILDGKPALIARFGSNEAECAAKWIGINWNIKNSFDSDILKRMNINAGVFPYGNEMAARFANIFVEAAKQIDLLGWWQTFMQDYLALEVCREDMCLTTLRNLEPYYSSNPWSVALKGKKVLVVHPFKETIENQYAKRELLFDNSDILPEFDLKVVKAVQTIAGQKDERFADWEDALNYMYQESMKHDFDVAIIGCGAYGMPLAAKFKMSGKTAIHLGGATQVLFGIKGQRWDNTLGKTLYNEHWTRPAETEIPNASKLVEGGCYW